MTKIKMKALTYQSVPQGNDKQYVDKEGEFFVFSEQEALARVERRLAERLSPEASTAEQEAAQAADEETAGPWTLSMSPQQYLDKYGDDAKHSAHAQAVMEREGGAKS